MTNSGLPKHLHAHMYLTRFKRTIQLSADLGTVRDQVIKEEEDLYRLLEAESAPLFPHTRQLDDVLLLAAEIFFDKQSKLKMLLHPELFLGFYDYVAIEFLVPLTHGPSLPSSSIRRF